MTDTPANVSLASLTTIGVGGPAATFLEATCEEALIQALREADTLRTPVLLLGGGSNLVVSDSGFPGLVIAVRPRGVVFNGNDPVLVEAAAGEPWDELVAWTSARGLAGLECLAGIPGLVGATPIQNVGAYGQEVSDTLVELRAWDRREQQVVTLPAAACRLSYRSSAFKAELRHRYAILSVRFALNNGMPAAPRQGELARCLAQLSEPPSTAAVREVVLSLRRAKGMVYDPSEPDSHSAGSFFVNPVVSTEHADDIDAGVSLRMPRFDLGNGRVKLAAAWLIEQAGFARGFRMGRAGLSTRHSLAITNRGDASTAEIVALARHIQQGVLQRFGVALEPEPELVGVSLEAPETGPSASA